MYRRSTPKSSPAALHAPSTFVEDMLAPNLGRQPAFDEEVVAILDPNLAVRTDYADQPLRQNAVQRRNEVVGLNPHIQKSPQHIQHIVRVNCSENKVSGE